MDPKHVGFVSTRFAGTDGVSLESAKWAQLLAEHSHQSYWYAGKLDRDPEVSMEVPEAWFGHPEVVGFGEQAFGTMKRSPELTEGLLRLAAMLKGTLYEFVERFKIDILVAENALCIPMHLPLGVALTQFIAETGFPTIAHHHDFYWERDRFSVNCVGDFLQMAFPPALPSIQHVTINSFAQQDLAWRKGCPSILVPNVLHFEAPPPPPVSAEEREAFRKGIGIGTDDILVLQPTRVVPRKGIEHAISLIAQLDDPRFKLLISHESGDEGFEYQQALVELAERSGVDLRFIDLQHGTSHNSQLNGHRIYGLDDVYPHADFVTYPSLYEGFGNALLEAIYFRKPILVNRYSIFITDIEPKGFKVIAMDGILTRDVAEQVRRVVDDADYRQKMVDHNYEVARNFFSYTVLKRKLRAIICNFVGADDL